MASDQGSDGGRKRDAKRTSELVTPSEEEVLKKLGYKDDAIDRIAQGRHAAIVKGELEERDRVARVRRELDEARREVVRAGRVLTYRQVADDIFPQQSNDHYEPIMRWQQQLWNEFKHYEHPSRRKDGAVVVHEAMKGFFKMIAASPPVDKEVYLERLKAVYARLLVRSVYGEYDPDDPNSSD